MSEKPTWFRENRHEAAQAFLDAFIARQIIDPSPADMFTAGALWETARTPDQSERVSRLEGLTRPIIAIENRTAQEVFDIMADRIRSALSQDSTK
jgi:hypothetical protein